MLPRIITPGDSRTPSTRPMRLVSIPAGHPYIERATAAAEINLLPDPPVPGAADGVWWPPAALDPTWLRVNGADIDVLHIHFGTESFPPSHLSACIDAARDTATPVIFTVHDLEHPQLGDQGSYARQLDELVPAVDALVTLTEGASEMIRARWGREATVIPHPSVLAPDAVVPSVLPSRDLTIGVMLKDLRPNVDAVGTVSAIREVIAGLHGQGVRVTAEVRMHHQVRDAAARDEIRSLCSDTDQVTLVEHERLDDRELVTAISRLDVCVLPYRHGTHSGWLELCWDLAVPVAAPSIGYYAEQHVDDTVAAYTRGDAASLERAVLALFDTSSGRPGSAGRTALVALRRTHRAITDELVASAHAALYRRVISEYRS
ncbi:MAG TPA: glycosyltransferase [Plantibacter sp.]|uniref:glycosyltransferase n=1 Tax=unclassified Plantibacter TaxID=2624265 RepID=UPI002BD7AD03|nr:glycosyltransferase [Plantibacter sp.]